MNKLHNMNNYTTYWFKDLYTRLYILVLWLFEIFLVNYWVYKMIIDAQDSLIYFLWMIIFWLILMAELKLVNNLQYKFDENWITISKPKLYNIFSNKNVEHTIPKDQIESIENVWKIWFFNWYWIKFNMFLWELMFTTSRSNILRINTNDWKKLLISPRKIEDWILKFYN